MSFAIRSYIGALVFLSLVQNVEGQISEPVLQKSYAHRENTAASQLIGEIAGADSAAIYRNLPREKKGTFLDAFWQIHNPLVLKYYYGYHLGQRWFSVSDAYFEQKKLLPKTYWTGAVPPDSTQVVEAVQICTRLLTHNPEDAVAMCALGYLNLEQNRESEAEKLFIQALESRQTPIRSQKWQGAITSARPQTAMAREKTIAGGNGLGPQIQRRLLQSGNVRFNNEKRGSGKQPQKVDQTVSRILRHAF